MCSPTLAKGVAQVNAVKCNDLIVLVKPTSMPISGADEVAKFQFEMRTSGVILVKASSVN